MSENLPVKVESAVNMYDRMGDPIAAAEKLGTWMAQSGLFGVNNVASGTVLALACIFEKRNPLEMVRTFHIIEGRLSMRADAMQAEFEKRGGSVRWIKTNAEECEAEFKAKSGNALTVHITLKELMANGVAMANNGKLKDNYQKFGAQTLRARCISAGVRAVDPAVVAGYYAPEEVADFVTATATIVPPAAPLFTPQPTTTEPPNGHAMTVEPAPTVAFEELSDIEDAANAYLCEIGWLYHGKTWRDLDAAKTQRIAAKPAMFREKVAQFAKDQEAANA